MRLRQKLFAAILAVMMILFLLLALVSFMQGLESQQARRELRDRLERGAGSAFVDAAAEPGKESWDRLFRVIGSLGLGHDWCVRLEEDGSFVAGTKVTDGDAGLVRVAGENGYELLLSPEPASLEPVSRLSGLFWAVAAGTAFLLLVVYGLLLRLVLRPVESLVSASRALSKGVRPPKVSGESRTDEMGELIGAFNRMTDEVCQSREELHARVEEATREYERAQKRLVLEQRLAATGKLAAGVAHEINNPLGGMINAARTLSAKEDGISERGREYLGLIEDGLDRIAKIVGRMREFTKARPSVGPVDLGETVRKALAFVRHRVDRGNVRLREQTPDEPVTVTGDAGELQQVFLNLILNALDALGDSETRDLTLGLDAEGPEAVVTITDTGAGMDPEQLANAFDLFYSTKGESGTGLGLGIAHKIVTDHGGTIELESSPGVGTTARVRLPLVGEDERGKGGGESEHS